MNKTLVAYFSAEGNTKVLAKTISDVVNGDIFEIAPTEKYTSADCCCIVQDIHSILSWNRQKAH